MTWFSFYFSVVYRPAKRLFKSLPRTSVEFALSVLISVICFWKCK